MTRIILAAALIVGAVACDKNEPPPSAKKPYKYSHSRELSRKPEAQPPMPSAQPSGATPSGVSPSGTTP
jgi:hypothetical protein